MQIPSDLETPLLLLDEAQMQRNIDRMQARMDALRVRFRPHVKTSKCMEVVRRQIDAGARGITVSTLKEAERFFAEGVDDILYAVAIAPAKLDHALRLARQGLRSPYSWSPLPVPRRSPGTASRSVTFTTR